MKRIRAREREGWRDFAKEVGFRFHTIDNEPYWDETACYAFTLAQIENDLEDPTGELERMCFEIVERAVVDERMMDALGIPRPHRDLVANSWRAGDRNLYGRFDFAYDGRGPAKLYEYNADTPTALYEAAFFQWVWLEQAKAQGILPAHADQFNSIQEKLVGAFARFGIDGPLHLACCRNTEEDRGTVDYLADCAAQAGLDPRFVFIEDIGVTSSGRFTDTDDETIRWLFKLYPWEWLFADAFGASIAGSGCRFIEPPWKALLSNKGLMPLLWEAFPGHPNLLASYFEGDPRAADLTGDVVRKPLLSREGANVEIISGGGVAEAADGPYGDEGFILQAAAPTPVFDGRHVVVGSWVVASEPCGVGLREDDGPITRDTSRFVPHVILD